MPSLAILLQVARADKPLKWEDKSLDFRDAMVIVTLEIIGSGYVMKKLANSTENLCRIGFS